MRDLGGRVEGLEFRVEGSKFRGECLQIYEDI